MYFDGQNNGEFSSFFSSAGVPSSVNYGLFSQIANSTPISNTLLEKTLIGSGVGGLIVPANGFKVGDSFAISMGGHITSLNNTDITFRIKADSVVLATSSTLSLPQTTAQHWTLNIYFTIRAIGSVGVASIQTSGQFTYTKDASNAFEGTDIVDLNNTTFNTTISNTLDITAQWASASASNIIYSETLILNKIF